MQCDALVAVTTLPEVQLKVQNTIFEFEMSRHVALCSQPGDKFQGRRLYNALKYLEVLKHKYLLQICSLKYSLHTWAGFSFQAVHK
jgi:hypothetical protein